MCGRFARLYTWEELVALYRLTLDQRRSNLQPRYNVCPTTLVDAVVSLDGKRTLEPMRWGLIPYWWSKPLKEMRLATFNARAETVATKPMFPRRLQGQTVFDAGVREDTPGGKQPWYFTRRDGQVMTVAALRATWKDREAGTELKSCSMVITKPNKFVGEVHDRMPVILEPKDFELWEHGDTKDAAALMKPADECVLHKIPVSKRVNSSRAPDDDAKLIEKLEI
jgi:putative SOS response-associated peptidase YedK